MRDRGFRWAMALLVMLGTVATGMMIGEQASADIPAYYASRAIVPEHGQSRDTGSTLADEASARIETSDLSYDGPVDGDLDGAPR